MTSSRTTISEGALHVVRSGALLACLGGFAELPRSPDAGLAPHRARSLSARQVLRLRRLARKPRAPYGELRAIADAWGTDSHTLSSYLNLIRRGAEPAYWSYTA